MIDDTGSGEQIETADAQRTTSKLTIPNVICVIRLVGSLALLPLAVADQSRAVLILFLVLAASDWVDGKLAILLNQRSVLGARLDSYADWTLYSMLLFATLWLKGTTLAAESGWLILATATFAVAVISGLLKFGQLPSYHTRSAKTSWLLMIVATVALLSDISVWPLRIAMVCVTIANLESILITRYLREPRTDIASWFTLRRRIDHS